MGILRLPVREPTCLKLLSWFAILLMDILPLDIMARGLLMLSQRPRLMLVFTMEVTDMVLDMLVSDMLDMVMDIPPMDTPPLVTMARDLLMLSLRPMLVFIMEDMDMVLDMLVSDMLVLDMLDTDMDTLPTGILPLDTMARDLLMLSQRPMLMLDSTMEDMDMVLAMLVLAMLDMDVAILPMDTPPLDTMARGLLKLSQRPRPMLDSTMADMDMVLDIPVLAILDMAMVILPMALATVDTIMVKPFSFNCNKAKAQDNY